MSRNHHGHPIRDWTLANIQVQDCPRCGRPVYDLPEYGGQARRVLLDALPLRTYRLAGHAEPYAALEHDDDTVRFAEHVCALGQE